MFYPPARRMVKTVLIRLFLPPQKVHIIWSLVSHQHSYHEKNFFIQSRMSQTSKKRKASESSSAAPQQPKRLARDDSVLAEATSSKLGLSSTSSYSLVNLPSSASKFKKRDIEALNITFRGASGESDVIPDVECMSCIAYQQAFSGPIIHCLNLV